MLGVRQLPPCSCECVRVCVALFFCFARVCLLAPTWFCGQLSSRCGLLTALARLAAFVRVRLTFRATGPLCGPKALSYRFIQVVCPSFACRLFAFQRCALCAPQLLAWERVGLVANCVAHLAWAFVAPLIYVQRPSWSVNYALGRSYVGVRLVPLVLPKCEALRPIGRPRSYVGLVCAWNVCFGAIAT